MKRIDILREAREWIDTRWQHQGAVKGVGCDCVGLIAGVALALGSKEAERMLFDPHYRNYGRRPDPGMLLRACAEFLDPITVEAALPGDVLLLRMRVDPQHFAFLSGRNPDTIIHAYLCARRVIEMGLVGAWGGLVLRAYRLRGVQ